MTPLLSRLEAGESLDLRADGKAGCGLVMILQIFAEAVSLEGTYLAQEWPLFSSARKGANVRGFLRIAKGSIHTACQIERPQIALLVTEKTGHELDFAEGMSSGLFVINSPSSPQELAHRFRLRGVVCSVPGDRLGEEYLGRPIPNIAVLAAMNQSLGLVSAQQVLQALRLHGAKRRLPHPVILANQRCFLEALKEVRSEEVAGEADWTHPLPRFEGYKNYPLAAQSRLRTSLTNQTANYARPGRRLVFRDPEGTCNGCSLCIVNCPEGIIRFEPDEQRGVRVLGADTAQFCKLCRECIEVCPLDLFQEADAKELESARGAAP